MTERAGDADTAQSVMSVDQLDRALDTNDGVEADQSQCGSRAVNVDDVILDTGNDDRWKCFGVQPCAITTTR